MSNESPDYMMELRSATEKLAKPAGASAAFSTIALIEENKDDFVMAVNRTWKELHMTSLERIIEIERLLVSKKCEIYGKGFIWYLNYIVKLWRRVNDSIIWSIFKERYYIKRLCLYRKRPPLIGANIESEMNVLSEFNSNPYNMAVLNDATSCVDIGDITLVNPIEKIIQHIEIKEGKVNNLISNIFSTDPTSKEFNAIVTDFFSAYGEKGFKQLKRFYKQQQRNIQAEELIATEEGYDPYTQRKMKIKESKIIEEYYDEELNSFLTELSHTKDGVICIDECLWIYASYNVDYSPEQHKKRFLSLIHESTKNNTGYIDSVFDMNEEGRVIQIMEWLEQAICIPMFMRNLSDDNINEITTGTLLTRAFLYIDWHQFGKLFRAYDGTFFWSSKKEGRREKAQKFNKRTCMVLDDRIPTIEYKWGKTAITGANLIRILFDGLCPRTIAAQLSEIYDNYA